MPGSYLKQVQREHQNFLVLQLITRELSTPSVHDEIVGAIPGFEPVPIFGQARILVSGW
jgi:hypothetical protein